MNGEYIKQRNAWTQDESGYTRDRAEKRVKTGEAKARRAKRRFETYKVVAYQGFSLHNDLHSISVRILDRNRPHLIPLGSSTSSGLEPKRGSDTYASNCTHSLVDWEV